MYNFFKFFYDLIVGALLIVFIIVRAVVLVIISFILAVWMFGATFSAIRKQEKDAKKTSKNYVDAVMKEIKDSNKKE